MVINPGGSLPTTTDWKLLPLAGTLTSLGAPFSTNVEYAVIGSLLVFRGIISTPGGAGAGFQLATLPSSVPAPAFTRRLWVMAGTSASGLNLNTDRTLTTGSAIGEWVALDSAVVALP